MRISSRWWLAVGFVAVASPAAAQGSGDWTTYGGDDWEQRDSRVEKNTPAKIRGVGSPDGFPDRDRETGLIREHSDRRQRGDVRDYPVQHRDGLRPQHQEGALALRAQTGHHHFLLRP